MSEPQDWDLVAPDVLKAAQEAIEVGVRKAADDLYDRMLYSVQEYFVENAAFNIASTIETCQRNMAAANEQREATEAENRRLIADAKTDAVAQVRREAAMGLRARAEWLKSEYTKGGSYEYLRPREEECRAVADMVEKGRFV